MVLPDGQTRMVATAEVDGRVTIEGDILVHLDASDNVHLWKPTAEGQTLEKGAYRYAGWPGGVIPWRWGANYKQSIKNHIMAAMNAVEAQAGGLDFVPRTTQADYLIVYATSNPSVCSSAVGRQGGAQGIVLGLHCPLGTMIHEFGHTGWPLS